MRAVKNLCERLGFDPPTRTLHAFRHTFAVNYLRRRQRLPSSESVGAFNAGDDAELCEFVDGDLQAVHERVSLLSQQRA